MMVSSHRNLMVDTTRKRINFLFDVGLIKEPTQIASAYTPYV